MSDELDIAGGDSAAQRAAELAMLEGLSAELGIRLSKRRFPTSNGSWAEVDGASDEPPVLVEVWAHQGAPKPAQKAKVLTDAMKLVWVDEQFQPGATKILLFSDAAAVKHFQGRTWAAAAIADLGINIGVIGLSPDLRAAVLEAQARQAAVHGAGPAAHDGLKVRVSPERDVGRTHPRCRSGL